MQGKWKWKWPFDKLRNQNGNGKFLFIIFNMVLEFPSFHFLRSMTPYRPTVSLKKLHAAQDPLVYLNVILEAFQQGLAEDADGALHDSMNMNQHSLMAFSAFHGQVAAGGFIQLIHNGFGTYIFENPFAEVFGEWGAKHCQSLIERASPLFEKHRAEIERETTLEEFVNMYEAFPAFDSLDQEYLEVMESETEIIRAYVESHLEDFVIPT
jgi:hypothetical protein